ncbi:hypothetical protein SS50377_23193 [Spironucleus salmonicida]|uniref:Uncharacterized protein n=1 Tax=Spironucleus salmonicida TaxID=348837 RepID=V6LZM3_9EUKA|nr:hypothetical protein SS50377_23193 [Spironucleus salmonicida]|eukprot:EST46294.1 Hypothetical protein SS50377_13680 [Spironucleus salmonicida]
MSQKRRPKANDEFKQKFQYHLIKIINQQFNTNFSDNNLLEMIKYYENLHQSQKKLIWDNVADSSQEDRLHLYKFYNNTFKASASPSWPSDLLETFAKCAREQAQLLAAEQVPEKEAILKGVELVKQKMHIREYVDFHQETAHHKIRNAFLPAFKKYQLESAIDTFDEGFDFPILEPINQTFEQQELMISADNRPIEDYQLSLSMYDLPLFDLGDVNQDFNEFYD